MLHIRQLSDVHLEFHYDLFDGGHGRAAAMVKELLPPLPTDKKSVLIIGGDLAPIYKVQRIITFLTLVQPRFRHVIYVLGNHEHYHGLLEDNEDRLLDALHEAGLEMNAITVVGNRPRVVVQNGVRFICGTLWTNYLGMNEMSMELSSRYLNDHHTIQLSTAQPRLITPHDLLSIFNGTVVEFKHALERSPDMKRTVVVTHHMPSYQAIDPMFTLSERDRLLNGAFASDLDEFILAYQPAYWFFGHTHTPYRGKVGETQLVCNPIGYPNEDNVGRGRYVANEVFSL